MSFSFLNPIAGDFSFPLVLQQCLVTILFFASGKRSGFNLRLKDISAMSLFLFSSALLWLDSYSFGMSVLMSSLAAFLLHVRDWDWSRDGLFHNSGVLGWRLIWLLIAIFSAQSLEISSQTYSSSVLWLLVVSTLMVMGSGYMPAGFVEGKTESRFAAKSHLVWTTLAAFLMSLWILHKDASVLSENREVISYFLMGAAILSALRTLILSDLSLILAQYVATATLTAICMLSCGYFSMAVLFYLVSVSLSHLLIFTGIGRGSSEWIRKTGALALFLFGVGILWTFEADVNLAVPALVAVGFTFTITWPLILDFVSQKLLYPRTYNPELLDTPFTGILAILFFIPTIGPLWVWMSSGTYLLSSPDQAKMICVGGSAILGFVFWKVSPGIQRAYESRTAWEKTARWQWTDSFTLRVAGVFQKISMEIGAIFLLSQRWVKSGFSATLRLFHAESLKQNLFWAFGTLSAFVLIAHLLMTGVFRHG